MNVRFPDDVRLDLLITVGLVVALMLGYHVLSRRSRAVVGQRARVVIWSIAGAAAVGSLLFALRPAWREPVVMFVFLAIIGIATVLVFYRLVYQYLGPRRVATLLVLRCLGIAAILLLLFRPVLSFSEWVSKPVVAILIDSSQSMSFVDSAESPTGGATRYQRSLDAVDASVDALRDLYDVKFYRFDQQVQQGRDLRDFYDLAPEGPQTDMTLALQEAVMLNPGQKLAALFMLTDGNHNAPGGRLPDLKSVGAETFLVGVGSKDIAPGGRDLAVVSVQAPDEVIAFNETKIAADVRANGFGDTKITVQLKEGDTVLATQEFLAAKDRPQQTIELSYVPQRVGRRRLSLSIPPDPAETTDQNNRLPFSVFVTDPQIKVLYFERPRPEYRELHRTLAKDRNIELATCVLTRTDEFSVKGSVGGKPLVGVPGPGILKKFDVFIIGSVERQALGLERLAAIRDAVKAGKGLLMLGGTHGLGPGGYGGTPLEEAMPVKLGGPALGGGKSRQENGRFLPVLTTQGKSHPIFTNIVDFFPDDGAGTGPGRLARLRGCVIVDGPKPAAQVLAVHPKRNHLGAPLIVVAVQPYGEGRSAVMTADSTHQWARQRNMLGQASPYHIFWRQMIRWLASTDVKEQAAGASVQIVLDRVYLRQGQGVQIKARVRGKDGKPFDQAAVQARIKLPGGKTDQIVLPRLPGESGWYGIGYDPGDVGPYEVTVSAREAGTAEKLGSETEQFSVDAPTNERDQLALNEEFLVKLARTGHGRYLALADLPSAFETLRAAGQRRIKENQKELKTFDYPLELFLVFVALVTTEWLLRRRWQLT